MFHAPISHRFKRGICDVRYSAMLRKSPVHLAWQCGMRCVGIVRWRKSLKPFSAIVWVPSDADLHVVWQFLTSSGERGRSRRGANLPNRMVCPEPNGRPDYASRNWDRTSHKTGNRGRSTVHCVSVCDDKSPLRALRRICQAKAPTVYLSGRKAQINRFGKVIWPKVFALRLPGLLGSLRSARFWTERFSRREFVHLWARSRNSRSRSALGQPPKFAPAS